MRCVLILDGVMLCYLLLHESVFICDFGRFLNDIFDSIMTPESKGCFLTVK